MKRLTLFIAVLSYSVFAQPIILSSDIATQYAIGNSATIHEEDSPTTINIGSLGGGNNWNFTSLQAGTSTILTSVNPSSTPHIGEFPGADIALYTMGLFSGEQAEIWAYSKLGTSLDFMGSAIVLTSYPSYLVTIEDNPPSQGAVFPLSWNSHWAQTYSETIAYNGIPTILTNYSIDVTVDAYGTMTLPGGTNFVALRSRYVQTDGLNTTVTYNYISAEGASVKLFASDSNPPTTGVININGYSWNTAFSSDVEQISSLAEDYSLRQNYPNPFNPSTSIQYSIPHSSQVRIQVYDVLGNEVELLVNEYKPVGIYQVEFNASVLPSGVYMYQLQAGNFVETKKMVLMK